MFFTDQPRAYDVHVKEFKSKNVIVLSDTHRALSYELFRDENFFLDTSSSEVWLVSNITKFIFQGNTIKRGKFDNMEESNLQGIIITGIELRKNNINSIWTHEVQEVT